MRTQLNVAKRRAALLGLGMAGLLIAATSACDLQQGADAGGPSGAPASATTTPAVSAQPSLVRGRPTSTPTGGSHSGSGQSTPTLIRGQGGHGTTTSAQPVLGTPWAPNQEGYGQVRPGTVFNGGDPTGLVSGISWTSWGGASAVGQGTAAHLGPDQIVADAQPATATIVGFDLGVCKGKLMYQKVEWYFPEYGGAFDPDSYINICTGDYHEQ